MPGESITVTPTGVARTDGGSVGARFGMDDPRADLIQLFLFRFDNPRTRRAYFLDLAGFFGCDTVSLEVARRITFVDINRHLDELSRNEYRPATIRRRLAAIRGFFDWLDALGVLDSHPAKRQLIRRLPRIRSSDSAILVLSIEQATALVNAAADNETSGVRDSTLVLVLLHLVLRRSEAAAMDVAHLRPIGSYTVLDLPDTKGGRDQYVKVPEHVEWTVREHLAHYSITSGPVWRSLSNRSFGKRLTPHSIYRIVRTAAQKAGLPDIGAHTLRHTGCTLAIEAGASLQQVQAHARHKKLETTMVYVHQRDRLRDSAADYIHIGSRKPD